MKLLPSVLLGAVLGQDNLAPLQAISFAHSRVRNSFRIPEMDMITEMNERLLEEVMAPSFNQRLVSLDEMISKSENITTQFRAQGKCDSSFPTLDGSCNHPEDKSRAMMQYERLVAAEYCDGKEKPRCSKTKRELPSERTISLAMRRAGGPPKESATTSYLFTAWGQFLTHDIIQTPDVGNGQVPCDCKPNSKCKNIRIDRANEPTLTFPCMFVIRSSSKLGRGVNGQPQREQLNQLTPLIDATTVYGVSERHKNLLLAADKMHLKMGRSQFGSSLPTVKDIPDKDIKKNFETSDVFNTKRHEEFVAGDTRVLENPTLSSYHTMFARLHNLAVDEFIKLNPHWGAMRVFEEARLLVMSMLKQVNYAEHLPILLGPQQTRQLTDLKVSRGERRARTAFVKENQGPGIGVRANGQHQPPADTNPQIRQEFLLCGYRWGHAQVTEKVTSANSRLAIDRSRDLKDSFFDPDLVHMTGPGGCLRGAMAQRSNEVSGSYAESTQNNLFKPSNFQHGADLLSINQARGREHGVAGYEAVKAFCMRHPKFGKFYGGKQPAMKPGWGQVLSVYDHKDDVDLYVGMLFEEHLPGGAVGPTQGCTIAEQFIALRKGDRFWHENKGVLTDEQLTEVKNAGLAKIMCTTLENMNRVAQNPFLNANVNFDGAKNGIQTCDKIGKLNFGAWKERTGEDKPTPAPVASGEKEPNIDVSKTTVACRVTGPRRKGIILCGAQDWDDSDLAEIVASIKQNNAVPIRGKTATVKGFPLKSVRRLSLAHNEDLTSATGLKALVSLFPNLNEINISKTGLKNVDHTTFDQNSHLFHLKAIDTPSSCFSTQLAMKLEANMKKNMKRFILL